MHRLKQGGIAALLAAALLLITAGLALDNRLQSTHYTVYDGRIPAAFEGFKIAQLSDIHSQWFGEGQGDIIAAVDRGRPDIIVLTGDILDARTQDHESIAVLLEGLTKIAPVYAVSGNHEADSIPTFAQMKTLYAEYGVVYLKDSGAAIEKDGAEILIYGLNDRRRITESIPRADPDTFGILLFHRSNLFDSLTQFGYGLVLSGHSHGGLIRLPFAGGIISPEGKIDYAQKYDGGLFKSGGTTLISSRGLASTHKVPRIFNRPEIVFVTLHPEE